MPATKRTAGGLTQKQEKFVLRYFAHGIESRAYAEAFNVNDRRKDTWVRKEAWILLQKPEIQQRLAELNARAENDAIYGHRECMLEAHEAYLIAKDAGDSRGMVAAAHLKAKVSGLIIERSAHLIADVGSLSDEEVAREHERINDQLVKLGHRPLPALALPRERLAGSGDASKEPEQVR